jgi:hypothetical protein
VEILDLKDQRTTLTALEAHLLESVKGPCPDCLWGQRRKAFCPILHPEQVEEIGGRVLGVHAHFLQRTSYLLRDCFRAICLADITVMAQDVDQRMIGHRTAIGETASFEIGDPLVL